MEGGGGQGAGGEAELARDGGPDHPVGQAAGQLGTEQEPEIAEAAEAGPGKTVTVVDGLPRNTAFLKDLSQELKRACGTGGAVFETASA